MQSYALSQGLACVGVCFKLIWTKPGVNNTFFEQTEALIFQDDPAMVCVCVCVRVCSVCVVCVVRV